MIVDSSAGDIVYSNYFTGIHGNYLKPSIVAAGMDPDNLPEADPSKMDFETATTGAKAWKDIWGCGQGIGAVTEIAPVADLVDRLDAGILRRRDQGWRCKNAPLRVVPSFFPVLKTDGLKSQPFAGISPSHIVAPHLRNACWPL